MMCTWRSGIKVAVRLEIGNWPHGKEKQYILCVKDLEFDSDSHKNSRIVIRQIHP